MKNEEDNLNHVEAGCLKEPGLRNLEDKMMSWD
jgi:hypothetical protein